MVSEACLNAYKATYTSTERTIGSELGHSFVLVSKELQRGEKKKVISLPGDAKMLETETEYLLLVMHV